MAVRNISKFKWKYAQAFANISGKLGQPVLAGTPILSFAARMPLLSATSAFELGRRC